MKLYPYTPNVNAVRKHFVDMAEGKEQIGYGAKGKYSLMKRTKPPRIQLVTQAGKSGGKTSRHSV